jgi:cyclohexadieny/prephenate dehydrogenase
MKVTVVGLGLIGASVAKALRSTAHVAGIDTSSATISQALHDGVIAEGSSDMTIATGSDVVVIAVPVGSIVDAAWRLLRHIDENTVLTDTGSTKAHIVESIDRVFPCFVGSHPIAGKENPGYTHSQADLFRNAMTIITPSAGTRRECQEKVERLWEACGSHTHVMDPLAHDRLMAVISHMPHLLSYASMSMAGDASVSRRFLGAGFRDFTRIAASDPVMWRDIFLDNREHILPLMDRFMEELKFLRALIEEGKEQELEKVLSSYAQIRRSLYGDSR